MSKRFRYCAVVLALAMCRIAPATAQFPPPPPLPTPPAEAQPVPAPPKGKKAPAPANSSIVGNWSGQLTQIGGQTPYKFELVIGPRGAETTYPDLDCTGTLTRVGASKSYVFFVEIIAGTLIGSMLIALPVAAVNRCRRRSSDACCGSIAIEWCGRGSHRA